MKNFGGRIGFVRAHIFNVSWVVACFGDARLIRQPDGRHELVGGTRADCAEAREWCAMFAPEIAFENARPSGQRLSPVA